MHGLDVCIIKSVKPTVTLERLILNSDRCFCHLRVDDGAYDSMLLSVNTLRALHIRGQNKCVHHVGDVKD